MLFPAGNLLGRRPPETQGSQGPQIKTFPARLFEKPWRRSLPLLHGLQDPPLYLFPKAWNPTQKILKHKYGLHQSTGPAGQNLCTALGFCRSLGDLSVYSAPPPSPEASRRMKLANNSQTSLGGTHLFIIEPLALSSLKDQPMVGLFTSFFLHSCL